MKSSDPKHNPMRVSKRRPVLADGAMGTELYRYNVSTQECFDVLNLTQPELVLRVHSDYISTGADLIETNTFGRIPINCPNTGWMVAPE